MRNLLVMIAALSLMISGCGKDDEPMQEPAAEGVASEQQAETSMNSMQQESDTTKEADTATMEGAAAGMAEDASGMAADGEAEITGAAPAAEESMVETQPEASRIDTAADDSVAGKKVYDQACFICHAQGTAGAPKIGDKAAWEPRIAKGMDTLVNHAINGFQGETGVMPPKGGFMNLSDEEITAAVAYMIAESH